MTTLTFYRRVVDETGHADRDAVKRGTAAVLHALRDRLMPTEAAQAAARFLTIGVFAALKEQLSPGEAGDVCDQLPRDLKEVWEDA